MSSKRKPRFGQNFLVDENARRAIVDAMGAMSDRTIIEIGPGHGAITSLLAGRARRLVAIELDRGLAAELTFKFRDQPTVQIVMGDVLETQFEAIVPAGETADVIGNLPYYITSDILLKLFAAARNGLLRRAVVMMQREVADRITAAPGVKEYGLLAATAQMNAAVDNLFTLRPEAFSPPPDVHSTVVRLDFTPRFTQLQVDAAGFDTFLKQVFAQKRKTLANNLRAAGFDADRVASAWPPDIPPQARAESLGLEAMASLYRALFQSA